MNRARREPSLAWAAAALGMLEAFAPGGAAWADDAKLPTGPQPHDLSEETTLHVPRAGKLDGGVRALAFSSDGRWLATAGADGSVYAFDLSIAAPGGATVPRMQGDPGDGVEAGGKGRGAGGTSNGVGGTNNGTGGTSGGASPGIDGPGGAPQAAIHGPLFRHVGSCAGVSIVGAGARIVVVSAGDDGVIAWCACPQRPAASTGGAATTGTATVDATRWPDVVTASAGLGPITALAIAGGDALDASGAPPADHVALVGTEGGTLGAFAPRDLPRPLWTSPGAHRGAVTALASLEEERLASAGADGVVRLSSEKTGKEQRHALVSKLELTSLAAAPGGKTLAVGGWERGVHLLDAATLKPARPSLEPHKGQAQAVALIPSKGGALLLATASIADEMVALSESRPSGAKEAAPPPRRVRPAGVAGCLAASPDGARLAAGTFTGDVVIYRVGEKP